VQRTATPEQVVDRAQQERDAAVKQAPAERTVESPAPSKKPTLHEPLSPEAIVALRARIDAASDDFGERIEARRVLFHQLRKHGQVDLAVRELDALLDDVERHAGLSMAQRVAIADAGNLQSLKDYRTAIRAYELLVQRYGDGNFAPEALLHMGSCYLELRDYVAAEQVWERLIEEYDSSPHAPWGWRKLALAQTLQGRFDSALATLEIMAEKYAGTHFGEYGRMRRGYVQMTAGRLDAARATYAAFLESDPHSKYCRLVRRQMAELEETALARADSRRADG
jgi:TolA-binding protein